ncbi:MAG: hypothetical protein KGM97_00565, partial [Alphaproteobacteria bacterium]|nr:hypothetical protein [Alphaproteobacteria bacterium]
MRLPKAYLMVCLMQGEKERNAAGSGPDFRHIDTWIFDLDNTLYPAGSNLFAQIDERMTRYISQQMNLPIADARR